MSLQGFNLLQDHTPPDGWDRVYTWVSSVGRVIVIGVEIVVIFAFLARVVIDTQTKALLETQEQLTRTVTTLRNNELQFIDRQNRFRTFGEVWNYSTTYSAVLNEIEGYLPSDIENLTLTARDSLITIQGRARVSEVTTMESKLKGSASFSSVQLPELQTVSTVGGPRANFNFRITIKDDKLRARPQIGEVNNG